MVNHESNVQILNNSGQKATLLNQVYHRVIDICNCHCHSFNLLFIPQLHDMEISTSHISFYGVIN